MFKIKKKRIMQQVPASFYGGMDFKINTSAYTNFMLKRQAQQAAKEAALDKYYKGLTATATSTGIRSQDFPAFDAAMKDYEMFYMENSSKIASGKYPELELEAQRRSRIPFLVMNQSKSDFARDKTVATIRGSNKKEADLWTEGTWDAYKKSTKPRYLPDPSGRGVIENPEYGDFDPMAIQTHPEEVDLVKQWEETGKNIPLDIIETKQADDIDPKFTTKVTTKTRPTPAGLKTVADRAFYQWNKETEYTFGLDKTFAQFKIDSPEKFNELLKSYQKVFGDDAEMKNDKDLYIATAINMADKEQFKSTDRFRDDKKWADYNRQQNMVYDKQMKIFEKSLNPTQRQEINNVRTYFEDIPSGFYTTSKGQKVEKRGDVWVDATGKALTTTGDNIVKITSNIPDAFAKNAPGKASVAVDYIDLHVNNGIASGGFNDLTNFVPRSTSIKQAYKGTGVKVPVQQINTKPASTKYGF